MRDIVFDTWKSEPVTSMAVRIIPDGCRDLIVRVIPGASPQWFISDLDDETRAVQLQQGVFIQGFRLRPGTCVNEYALLRALQDRDPDVAETVARIQDFAARPLAISEALDCLSSGVTSVAEAATNLGVSQRTLQRLLINATGRAPSFWLRLARVRQSARALLTASSITDVAFAHGYADQAHMSREFRQWLGISPGKLKLNPDIGNSLLEPGYA